MDVLIAFGWRDARPNPVSVRDDQATMIQPLTLANGIASNRIVRLSDDNALTAVCLQERPLVDLIDELFQRILSRAPNPMEVNLFCELLQEGFESRRIDLANHPAAPAPKRRQDAVSWSNHLSAEATRIRNEQERALRAGDPPTQRLQNVWRERAEDCIWSLLNSPEFIFLP